MTLSSKVAALAGPDRAVDAEAHDALGLPFVMEYFTEHDTEPTRNLSYVPHYTASLDAAMSVVPEGWAWQLRSDGGVHLEKGDGISLYWYQGDCDGPYVQATAATPALALLSAALAARGL